MGFYIYFGRQPHGVNDGLFQIQDDQLVANLPLCGGEIGKLPGALRQASVLQTETYGRMHLYFSLMENISGFKWSVLIIWTCGLLTCRHLAKNNRTSSVHSSDPCDHGRVRCNNLACLELRHSSRWIVLCSWWSCTTRKGRTWAWKTNQGTKEPYIHNMPLNYEINHQIERHSALSEFPFTKGLGFIQLYKSGSSGIESHISCLSTMHLYNAGDGDGGTLPAEIFCWKWWPSLLAKCPSIIGHAYIWIELLKFI